METRGHRFLDAWQLVTKGGRGIGTQPPCNNVNVCGCLVSQSQHIRRLLLLEIALEVLMQVPVAAALVEIILQLLP